jgi:hypothetical protein
MEGFHLFEGYLHGSALDPRRISTSLVSECIRLLIVAHDIPLVGLADTILVDYMMFS